MELDDDLHLGTYSPLLNNNAVHHRDVSGTLTSLGKRSRGDMDGDRDSNNGDTNPNTNTEGSSPTSPLRCEGLIPASLCNVDIPNCGGTATLIRNGTSQSKCYTSSARFTCYYFLNPNKVPAALGSNEIKSKEVEGTPQNANQGPSMSESANTNSNTGPTPAQNASAPASTNDITNVNSSSTNSNMSSTENTNSNASANPSTSMAINQNSTPSTATTANPTMTSAPATSNVSSASQSISTPVSINPYSVYYPSPTTPLTLNTPTYVHPYTNPYYPYHHMAGPIPGPSGLYALSPNFVPPSVQRPPSEVQCHAKLKRLKAHTVTTLTSKSFSIPMVPRDKKGQPMLPLNVGIMTVINLGDVCMRKHFHTERYIFPVRYEVTRYVSGFFISRTVFLVAVVFQSCSFTDISLLQSHSQALLVYSQC